MSEHEKSDREKYPKRHVMGGQVYDRPVHSTPEVEEDNAEYFEMLDLTDQGVYFRTSSGKWAWSDESVEAAKEYAEYVKKQRAEGEFEHIERVITTAASNAEPAVLPHELVDWEELGHVKSFTFEASSVNPEAASLYFGKLPEAEEPAKEFEQFESGAIRDTHEGKPRFDLIDPTFLRRVALVMAEGAEHYGAFNWTKGIPSQRYAASLLRHVFAYLSGDRTEDHLGRATFNLQGLARNEGTDLDDLFNWGNK